MTDIVRLHERVVESRPVAGVSRVHATEVEVTVVTAAVAMQGRPVDPATIREDVCKRTFGTKLAVSLYHESCQLENSFRKSHRNYCPPNLRKVLARRRLGGWIGAV